MKKFVLIGTMALLTIFPVLTACGGNSALPDEAAPEIFAPVPEISDPVPPFSAENGEIRTPESGAQYIRVCVNGLNVRSGADISSPAVGQAERGVLLAYEGTEGGWHRTQYRGKTAYVSASASYTALSTLGEGDARTEAVITEGMRLLGTPYVYGATRFHDGNGQRLRGFTADAFDCSSLMQYIFYCGADVLLDVTTRTQIKQGAHVEADDLRRGDLMFFTNASRQNMTGMERVGHVALYLGENYILHTASDYAKVEQISAARWGFFLEARRVL